jgi:hypothetical protein
MSGSEKAAAHCAEIAQRSSDPETRVSLTKMSVAWLRLADLAETNRESQPPHRDKGAACRKPIPVITTERRLAARENPPSDQSKMDPGYLALKPSQAF